MPTLTTLSTSVTSNSKKGRKATDLFRAAYDKVGLSEEQAQRLNENPKFPMLLIQLIQQESANQVIRENEILKLQGSITFSKRNTPIDPSEFFNRSSISLWGSFQEHILPALKPVASTSKRTYWVAGCLKKNVCDNEIRSVLPRRHLGNWEDIASLIETNPDGRAERYLLYLEGVGGRIFAVSVYWSYHFLVWCVHGLEYDALDAPFSDSQVLFPRNAVI